VPAALRACSRRTPLLELAGIASARIQNQEVNRIETELPWPWQIPQFTSDGDDAFCQIGGKLLILIDIRLGCPHVVQRMPIWEPPKLRRRDAAGKEI